MVRLKAERRSDGWWITGWPKGFEDAECGPYESRADLAEDKTCLERTLENWDRRSFWTTERPR